MTDDDRDTKSDNSAFANLLGPEPEWRTCRCGAKCTRVPCWDCSNANRAEVEQAEAVSRSLATFPDRYEWAKVDAPELAKRVKAANLRAEIGRVMASDRVLFAGPSGAGKTSLAVACLRTRVPRCRYVSALRLGTARIQHAAGDGEAELVERCMATPLLLIDEIGGEQKTATSAVRDVVFERYERGLPTWVTTGFSSKQLAEMYGEGMLRRLVEGAVVVKLGGKA